MERVASGDSASRQAVTWVNAEQASKRQMREPTWHNDREGCHHGDAGAAPVMAVERKAPWSRRGSGDGMSAEEDDATREILGGGGA